MVTSLLVQAELSSELLRVVSVRSDRQSSQDNRSTWRMKSQFVTTGTEEVRGKS